MASRFSIATAPTDDSVIQRSMDDLDGPSVAVDFYERVMSKPYIEADDIPYALDAAVQNLRETGAAPHRWATFIHLGA
jgi:hypothetical protein